MILKSLEIKNFRSFDEKGVSLRFNEGMNIIVGENNVGKSNVLRSLELFNPEGTQTTLTGEDYYKGETNREIKITAVLELDKGEVKSSFGRMFTELGADKIQKIFSELGNTVKLEYSSEDNRTTVIYNDFWLYGSHLWLLSDKNRKVSRSEVNWKNTQRIYSSHENELSFTEFIKRELKSDKIIKYMNLNIHIANIIISMFKRKVKKFIEIRQCPSGSNKNVLESYDGALVADVLANLKNGKLSQRRKWERIKQEFHNLFPNLKLEVTKPAGETPKIMIVKEAIEYEVPISFVGAGIWENVILLTHIFSFDNMCFGIDMPELHFHHHTLRLLRNILREKSDKNQFLIVTHSPLFIEPDRLENVLVVRERNGKSVVKQIEEPLGSNEKQRIRRHLDESNLEFLFSKAVLIVEGPTEKGAMPIFAKLLGKDFDKYGISVIDAGGPFFGIFTRILKSLDFPYLVMSDYDALMHICGHIERKGKSIRTSAVFLNLRNQLKGKDLETIEKMESRIQSKAGKREMFLYSEDCFKELKDIALRYDVHVLPSDFEGVLKRDGYGKLLKDARKFSGRKSSKVICGRYVAEKILEYGEAEKIPKEFREVVDYTMKQVD